MTDTNLSATPLDLAFHPTEDIVYTSLLNGEVQCFSYAENGSTTLKWKMRPSKKSCRAIDITTDGKHLWCGYKSGSIYILQSDSGAVAKEISRAHESPINRILVFGAGFQQVATGDDNGAVKIWDFGKVPVAKIESPIRSYTHHTDYISDFCWFKDKKHLVACSGDGTLSVMDVRSTKSTPLTQSEQQEDELLSIIPLKGGQKLAIGTQLGPIIIFDRKRGYGDCVDRFLGHPHSVETLANISGSRLTQDVVATGSSDGLIRIVQLLPSKFLGVIAAHGSRQDDEESPGEGFPVERIKLDRNVKWLGSISHDDVLKLTDIEGALEGSDDEDNVDESEEQPEETSSNDKDDESADEPQPKAATLQKSQQAASEEDSDSESPPPTESKAERKRRKKQMKREEVKRQKRARDGAVASTFFDDL